MSDFVNSICEQLLISYDTGRGGTGRGGTGRDKSPPIRGGAVGNQGATRMGGDLSRPLLSKQDVIG